MKRVTIVAGIAILVLAACGGAASSGGGAGAGGSVAISLTDNMVTLGATTVAPGKVTFTVKNTGSVVHSLVVLKTNLAHDKIPADPQDASRADERGKVAGSGQIAAGETKEFTVDLSSGKYVVMCNEPAHYLVGMHTALTVN